MKQLANHLMLSQGWLIKRTVQPFVTKFPFILTNLSIWKSCRRMTQLYTSIRMIHLDAEELYRSAVLLPIVL